MVAKALFDPLHISNRKIFKINTSLSPSACAENYIETIIAHFKGKPVHFDLILLGLGDNAHTASLFPFTDILHEKEPSVKTVFLKEEKTTRISMTAPLINQARNIAFLVFGQNKAIAVQQVNKESTNPEAYPAQLIHSENGAVTWFLDEKAAELL